MKKTPAVIKSISQKIYTIHDLQVMIDSDLADLYGVDTKVLNQAVKRNIERFPESFRFRLDDAEFENLKSQIVTSSSGHGGRRYLPYVFTEQGVAMLSAVLKSETAVKVSVQIMKAFVEMRKFLSMNAGLLQRMNNVELKQIETDKKIDIIFNEIENREVPQKQGVFFEGQVFDAYLLLSKIIRSANKSIVLIDNYIDESVIVHFSKRKKNVSFCILTKNISKKLELDIKKYNEQNPMITLKKFDKAHDRFLIIDDKTIYHFGASLKDLGKKWFAFNKIEIDEIEILKKVKELI